ncbi:hypothetical protein ElyMa_000851000 [Elysia marginata]|uniref:Uncharacterized protein n=1 Tax=Elysia marginata TaxID=1093978 RepID=A0AAV4H0P4_9GAST|nr:hypothetical protein ElyMa_000851000 [Elysia marginata]
MNCRTEGNLNPGRPGPCEARQQLPSELTCLGLNNAFIYPALFSSFRLKCVTHYRDKLASYGVNKAGGRLVATIEVASKLKQASSRQQSRPNFFSMLLFIMFSLKKKNNILIRHTSSTDFGPSPIDTHLDAISPISEEQVSVVNTRATQFTRSERNKRSDKSLICLSEEHGEQITFFRTAVRKNKKKKILKTIIAISNTLLILAECPIRRGMKKSPQYNSCFFLIRLCNNKKITFTGFETGTS